MKLTFLSSIKFLSKYIARYKKHFIMFYLGWLFITVLSIVMPILFGIMIDEIVYYKNVSTFRNIALLYATLCVFSCGLYFFIYAQHHYLINMYTFDIKMDIFNHYLKCDAHYLNGSVAGDIILMIQNYSTECMHFIIRNVSHLINIALSAIVAAIYLFIIDWRIGLIAVTVSPLSVYINNYYGKKIRQYGDIRTKYHSRYSGWLFEILSSIGDIRLLGAQNRIVEIFWISQKRLFDINLKSKISNLNAQNSINLLNLLVQLSIFALAGYSAFEGKISVGLLTIIISFYQYFFLQINYICNSYLDSQNRIAYIQHIYDFLKTPMEDERTDKTNLCVMKGELCLKNITFSYNHEDIILDDLNLWISAGERMALVGKSGSGKTTLIHMLVGLYKPTSGEIIIDGQNIEECNLKSIRHKIGIVQQNSLVFAGSIKDNILLGKPSASDEELKNACIYAGLWDFIRSLPEKWDTELGNEGMNLSGGQKQRVAIARIYLKNPSIIIFDEATSALDQETEKIIYSEWDKFLDKKTVIVITHRKSSVMYCQRVAILEDGKISEIGSLEHMIQNSKNFNSLFRILEEDNHDKKHIL